MKYELLGDIPTFLPLLMNLPGEPQIDTSQIPMINMPAFEPRKSNYKPNTVRTTFSAKFDPTPGNFFGLVI